MNALFAITPPPPFSALLTDGEVALLPAGVPGWLAEGRLDLFLILDGPGGVQRHFLADVPAPAWLPDAILSSTLSLTMLSHGQSIVTEAVPDAAHLAAGVTAWFEALGQAGRALGDTTREPTCVIEGGSRCAVGPGDTFAAAEDAVWCRWIAETTPAPEFVFHGVALRPGSAGLLLPVTQNLALTASEAGQVEGVTNLDMLDAQGWAKDAAAASYALVEVLAALAAQREAARRAWRGQRWTAMHGSFKRSMGDFARLLDGSFTRGRPGINALPPIICAALPIASALLQKPVPEFAAAPDEAPMDALTRFGAVCGLRVRRVRLEAGWISSLSGPMIVFLGNEGKEAHPVALMPGRWGHYDVVRPLEPGAPAQRERLTQGVASQAAPIAYVLQPTLGPGKLSYREILLFGLRLARWNLAELAAWSLLISLMGLLPPLAFSAMVGTIIPNHDMELLQALILAMLGAVATTVALQFASAITHLRMDGRLGALLHGAMVDRALRLPAARHRASTPVILATQLETVEKFRRAITDFCIKAGVVGVSALASVALLVAYAPAAGLIAAGCVVALVAAVALIGWRQFHAIYEGERMDVIVLAFVYELIRLVPTLRVFGAERLAFVQWTQNFLAFQSRLLRSGRINSNAAVLEAAWELPTLAIGFTALALTARNGLGMAAGVAFVVALGKLIAAGRELAHVVLGAAKMMPTAKLARSFIEYPLEQSGAALPVPDMRGRIELVRVDFNYAEAPVLKDVSMTIEHGQFIGIVGPSGSGKSTVLRLILGLDQPASGRVLLDGQDLSRLDSRLVRRRIGTVMQTSALFPGSIFENIRGATEITMDEAWHFAALADIQAEIEALPMKMHTKVGEHSSLSSGQVQRLLLARALAPRPRILVLDEATSALDSASQKRISAAVAALTPTRVMVAHRFATLRDCDRIFVMDQGMIVDTGNFAELAAREGLFRQLMLRQAYQPGSTSTLVGAASCKT